MVDLLQNCHVSFWGVKNDIMGMGKVWNNGRKCLMNMFFVEDIGNNIYRSNVDVSFVYEILYIYDDL